MLQDVELIKKAEAAITLEGKRDVKIKNLNTSLFVLMQFNLLGKNTEYEDNKAVRNPKYKDRAGKRRETIGSEGIFQRDDSSASVHM